MDEFGITPEAIADSIQQDLARFRDHRGNEWNGQGDMPTWLLAAKNAGVDPDFFRIDPTPPATTESSEADRRQLDLFFSLPTDARR